MKPPEPCPNCGVDVPRDAKACPECGADENTGWAETGVASNLGLPDEEFDHDEFVKE
jgi:predicted amidophosphoribosyltransferase